MNKNFDINLEAKERILRGKRIKEIREKELRLCKSDLAKQIGISGQFLGLVEEGKGNLSYSSIKLLRKLSNHSADYILYGLDDSVFTETRSYLNTYSEEELMRALDIIKNLSSLLKKSS